MGGAAENICVQTIAVTARLVGDSSRVSSGFRAAEAGGWQFSPKVAILGESGPPPGGPLSTGFPALPGSYQALHQTPSTGERTASPLRRDLLLSAADGIAYSVMVGCGETYLPAFALAVGLGPLAAGLIASLPVLIGAVVQLITPFGVGWLGSSRRWVIGCTTLQAISFLPLAVWALQGEAELWQLLAVASVYWSAGMAGVPAWSSWMGLLIPARVRAVYFSKRNRLGQFGVLFGFVAGGLMLQGAASVGITLQAFAGLFLAAAASRIISTLCLVGCREPMPGGDPVPIVAEPAAARRAWRHLPRTVAALAGSPAGALLAALWAFTFATRLSAPYFTPFLLEELRFSYLAYMGVIAAGLLAKAVALPTVGRIGSRIGSARLLRLGGTLVVPLSAFWLVSGSWWYLIGLQLVAGTCWAIVDLASALLFYDAVRHRERTGVVTLHNLGMALATLAGAAVGGAVLQWYGEQQAGYLAVFLLSSLARLVILPLLWRVRFSEAVEQARKEPAS